ncbi:MAG TPA: YciI family protein [Gaiellaceae bacterium]|nr:YciI family protein [Gaiellaceae bacterium]
MEFDHFTLVLLETNPDAPEASDTVVFDGHLAHLASLHDAGELIAAGPTRDDDLRGICVLATGVERARELMAADPAVQAGVFSVRLVPWRAPKGAIAHAPDARFPRSVADAST